MSWSPENPDPNCPDCHGAGSVPFDPTRPAERHPCARCSEEPRSPGVNTALKAALHHLLRDTIIGHPLPWHIVEDWTFEVVAADGKIVAKCMLREEADALIAEASRLDNEAKETERQVLGGNF